MSDDTTAMLTDQTKLIDALREALQTAAFNMQTMAGDIKNPGQRALVDRWIKQAHGAAALQSPVAAVSDGVREDRDKQANELLCEFYLSDDYDPNARRRADTVEAAIKFTLNWIAALATPAPDQGEVERLREALNAIIDRGPERSIKWAGMTARDIALAALRPDTDTGKDATK